MELNRDSIVSALREAGSRGLKTREIVRNLRVASRELRRLRSLLHQLESEGTIIRGRRRRYQLPGEAGFIRGTIFGYGGAVALLVPADASASMKVASENLHGAHHGDVVLARVARGRDGRREGQVFRVLEKAPSEVVGQISAGRGGRMVHVDHDHRHKSVSIERHSRVKPGDYVLVRVNRWGEPYERTRGRITEVLGGRFTPGEDFAGIVREFKLPLAFPHRVEEEIKRIPDGIPEEELRRREDLTDLLTFTIDPADAKDFDDAISVADLGRGKLRIGVHIADVSYYVRQGSYLDHEAMARGRSVYLVDRVIPMLPARLSSELAALQPDRPRLAVSVMMDVSRRGEVTSYEIKETVIRSSARLTYDDAQKLITKGAGWRARKHLKRIAEALKRVDELRQKLKERRVRRGAIELETPEVDILLDANGNAVGVKPAGRLASHNLIEELMILANETVANHMSYLGRNFIYRVHEVPDEKDMRQLAVFAATLGYRFRWTKGTSPRPLQSLLDKVSGRSEEYVISTFILRSLKKAQYSERNVGHFGLASQCYTHFTSPIRRYPDLIVHRLLKIYGLFKTAPDDPSKLLKFVSQAAEIASTREIEGDEAERAYIKAKIAEFMEHRIGEDYWGIVSGIKDFGFFVMLEENLVEGLVHVSTLGDDYYTPDSTGTMLVGSRTGQYYRIGDRVMVRVARVDRGRREVDFVTVGREGKEGYEAVAPVAESRSRKRRLFRALQDDVRRARKTTRRRAAPRTGPAGKPMGKRGRAMDTVRRKKSRRTGR